MRHTSLSPFTCRAAAISAVMLLLALAGAQAQERYRFHGLELGKTYTRDQVMKAIGQKPLSEEGYGWNDDQTVTFQGLTAIFRSGEFSYYRVTDRRWKVFDEITRGGVRVGDDIAEIFSLKEAYPQRDPLGFYNLFLKDDGIICRVYAENGRITQIDVSLSY